MDEVAGAVDGAIDVGFGGEMHHGVRLEIREGGAHGGGVADVGLEEGVKWVVCEIGEGGEVAGVGEFVDVEDLVAAADEEMDEIGTDEAGATGDEDAHGRKVEIAKVESGNGDRTARARRSPRKAEISSESGVHCWVEEEKDGRET
jgi:hypothetical protein